MHISFATFVGTGFATASSSTEAAASGDLLGRWEVENSTENHELQGVKSLLINADGSLVKYYKSSDFQKRWSISKGNLVLADVQGVTPGPPEEFVATFADSNKQQLRLKVVNSRHAKEIRLVKVR